MKSRSLSSDSNASAQRRVPDLGGIGDLARIGDLGRIGEAVNVQIKLGEVTLESIDFANQTATLNLGLDVANGILPVNLKDLIIAFALRTAM